MLFVGALSNPPAVEVERDSLSVPVVVAPAVSLLPTPTLVAAKREPLGVDREEEETEGRGMLSCPVEVAIVVGVALRCGLMYTTHVDTMEVQF